MLSLTLLPPHTISEPLQSERSALLSFIDQLPHTPLYNWNTTTSPYDWPGVSYDNARSSVITLRLPGTELIGSIPPNTISRLPNLRVLSLHYNPLTGPVLDDFSNLTSLTGIYLNNNRLTGPFLRSLTSLTRLNRIDLSSNGFSGPISAPVLDNNLPRLNRLFLIIIRFLINQPHPSEEHGCCRRNTSLHQNPTLGRVLDRRGGGGSSEEKLNNHQLLHFLRLLSGAILFPTNTTA